MERILPNDLYLRPETTTRQTHMMKLLMEYPSLALYAPFTEYA